MTSGTVRSADGTVIAFDRLGDGPPLILVDGALCYRDSGPMRPLAARLAAHFTVFTYDRRGRGESGDTAPYDVQREVEDIDALIQHAGGSALVFGISSGAALALEAANRGLAIPRLALYEAPFIVDATRTPVPDEYSTRLLHYVGTNRRADAVRHFMKIVGVPGFIIPLMRFMPAWSKLKGVAHTIPYDTAIVLEHQRGNPLPPNRWSSVKTPTLVGVGTKSPTWMRNAMQALAGVLPNATLEPLRGQTHMVKPGALAPVLITFFSNGARSTRS